jgi:hypothetical protein
MLSSSTHTNAIQAIATASKGGQKFLPEPLPVCTKLRVRLYYMIGTKLSVAYYMIGTKLEVSYL